MIPILTVKPPRGKRGGFKQHWLEIRLEIPHLWTEVLPTYLEERGFSGTWIEREEGRGHGSVMRAYLKEEEWDAGLPGEIEKHMEMLAEIFPEDPPVEPILKVHLIEEEDWASNWLRFFRPLKVGPVWIRPSRKTVPLAKGEQEIVIDPGQAFGTGHHETTFLCLESILRVRPLLAEEAPVLDLGTGSGILAMFAAKLGLKRILALDIDPAAVETAERNISLNGLEALIEVREGSIRSTDRKFALVAGNLTAPVINGLAADLDHSLLAGGLLVLSGILIREAAALLMVLTSAGLNLFQQEEKNEWACLVLRKGA